MNSYTEYINKIIKKVNNLVENEFKENNYKVIEEKIIKKEKKDSRYKQEVSKIQYNIYMSKANKKNKIDKMNNNKNKKVKNDYSTQSETSVLNNKIDLISDSNLFNVVDKEKLLKWKSVKLEDKKIKIKLFIDKNYDDFPDKLLTRIFELIDKNKINFKKYIEFNEYTQNIDSMPIISYNNETYNLNYSTKKVVKRKKITFTD